MTAKGRLVAGSMLGFVVFANLPGVLLMATGEPVTEENRSWMYGLFAFAAMAAGLTLMVRAVVRRARGRAPVLSRPVVASSTVAGFALMALMQLASIQPDRPELAAALQNFAVALAAAVWWLRARNQARRLRARTESRGQRGSTPRMPSA